MRILKQLLFLSLLLFYTTTASGQKKKVAVSGQVVGKADGQPLIGALVKGGDSKATITNKKGYFSLNLSEGPHTLLISYLGYETKKVDFTIPKETESFRLGTIEIKVAATSLNEIVVSGASLNYKSDFKGSNFRISPLAIKNMNPLSTEEVLRLIPGVNIIGDMGLSNRPNISIRGSWGRRSKKVLLLEDGSPAAPAPYIAPGAYYNPVSDRVQAIEVYKGADMLRFGPNNMYGAVNYITALPPQKPELRMKLVGGQRDYTTALFSYGGTWKNLGSLVEGVYKKFGGFVDNSSVELLNLNAKIFAQLSENQSLYFKVSGQFEDNQASLSSITPFTFETDPTQNPFDADNFTMRRYGLDILHKWLLKSNVSLTSKVYASDFERDWWRQVTTKVKASEVRDYVGERIFNERYSYLNDVDFDDEDYVIVGKISNGRESTTDSRWTFTVSGLKETLLVDWNAFNESHQLEVGLKLHQEMYKDRFLRAEGSRWARSGLTATDLQYRLWALSGYVRNEFHLKRLGITPIVRFEHINMYRQDLLALSQNPDLGGTNEDRQRNEYDVILPGLTLDYELPNGELFSSIYQGFIAPSKVFGFLVERDGVVTNPLAGEAINIQPELSLNTEVGWRGSLLSERLEGQLTYFNNTVRNFYAGGRHEVFEELGKINIQGIETGAALNLLNKAVSQHGLTLNLTATLLESKVISGALVDKDLFSQIIHSSATKHEFIEKVNANPTAYEVFIRNDQGNEVPFSDGNLSVNDFDRITKAVLHFGEDKLEDTEAPYTPNLSFSAGFNYSLGKLSSGLTGHYVSEQYSEFANFTNESADGAIGALPSFFTLDAFINYDFSIKGKANINAFINGKNLTNQIYRASRLNRATSGIFPGGFRQIIFGVNIKI